MSVGLADMPDELVLRFVALSGGLCEQMRAAYALGGTCRRLRRVLWERFLPTLSAVSQEGLNALALSDPGRATAALMAMLGRATSIRRFAPQGFPPQVLTAGCFGRLAVAAQGTLRSVNLAYSYLDDACVAPLLEGCLALEELSLASCQSMTGEAFERVAAPLASLDLSYMLRLSPVALAAVGALPKLRQLKVTGCNVVNGGGLATLGAGAAARGLRAVDIKCCPVGDEALLAFVACCPALRRLTLARHHDNLWETGQYTDASLHGLAEHYAHIEVIIEN